MLKYNLNPFLENITEWIESFRYNDKPGYFEVKKGKNKASLYGICDVIFFLINER